ncbi:hypothetical protein ACFZC5_18140 [Nocardia gamkensis]|uniref:hypothetical protein n=1 Tax=Nocardia gamkensis TaxID=352869 RepID=UPI0036EF5410
MRISKAWKDSGSRLTLGKPKTKRGVRTVRVLLATLDRLDLDRPGDELLFHTVNDTPMTAGNFHKRDGNPRYADWMPSRAEISSRSARRRCGVARAPSS